MHPLDSAVNVFNRLSGRGGNLPLPETSVPPWVDATDDDSLPDTSVQEMGWHFDRQRRRPAASPGRPGGSHASHAGPVDLDAAEKSLFNQGTIVRASLQGPAYVLYADNQVRRIPWNSQLWDLDALRDFLESFTDIYLPDPSNLVAVHAALQADDTLRIAADQAIAPLRVVQQGRLPLQIFLTDGGTFLVPQPSLRDCTYAAEATLLLQQGYLLPENVDVVFVSTDHRRDDNGLISSLKKRAGAENVIVISNDGDASRFLTDLKKGLRNYGPCILNQGHAVVLDAIDDSDGHILRIREPFHGTLLAIRQAETQSHDQSIGLYNDSPYKLDINLRWYDKAIFLRRRQDA